MTHPSLNILVDHHESGGGGGARGGRGAMIGECHQICQ